jgi:rubredoxin
MKKWRCTVCGYTQEGEEPPDKCPVCGADKKLFEQIDGPVETHSPAGKETATGAKEKKWRCTVCGYIHNGLEPPDKCPVCGADKSLFELVVEDGPKTESGPQRISEPAISAVSPDAEASRWAGFYKKLIAQMLKHHAHPISVHIPNGVVPMSVLFVMLAAVFQISNLDRAAFYNMIFVVLTLPFVLFSGYVEWKNRYGGHLTRMFLIKIICAGIVTVSALAIVVWWIVEPAVATAFSPNRAAFVLLHLVMLGAAAIAGLIGGKLVFKD